MARKSKTTNPEAVVTRLRAAHAQLRLQSERASRAADTLGRLITQLEAELRSSESQPRAPGRTS